MPTAEEEARDPFAARQAAEAATTWLRVRAKADRKKYHLVFSTNCDFGFCRNTWGMKWIGLLIASGVTAVLAAKLYMGAEPASVARMIVRQGALVALAGIAIGLATALAGSRLIELKLYGVSSRDLGVFATTPLMLLTVALFACWLPARRAARLDPLDALRTD